MPPRRKNFGKTTAHAEQQREDNNFKDFVLGGIEGYMLWLRYQSSHKLDERQIEVLSKTFKLKLMHLYAQVISVLITKYAEIGARGSIFLLVMSFSSFFC